ncbi:hypothetical protein HQQ94_18555 [Shewanella sp. VB17]|uniref:hypothetical protein n=1 Tax=Shewanella sp. VB17 TaxID=2739432 RepID=UPI0015644486|nr:hypothetical protein [Shewanella sp. VB17]NRD75185.1 hypothetical protein [Shewanella sp. VB17]
MILSNLPMMNNNRDVVAAKSTGVLVKKSDVLEDALRRTAIIHQSHSLKAFLSACFLEVKLDDFNDQGWQKCHELIAHDELATEVLFSPSIESQCFHPQRIDGILKRGLFPASYIAMKSWLAHSSIEEIFSFYEKQAIEGNEYLLHTVSILLSFKRLWPSLDAQQLPYAIERFTEFVTSTYYHNNHIEYPQNTCSLIQEISVENAILKAVSQPGFWGHNLICLSWLLDAEDLVSAEFREGVLAFIIEQSNWVFPDADDVLNQAIFETLVANTDRAAFHQAINHLIYGSTRNIHQITLAAALVSMWDRVDSLEIKANLYKICCYFSSEAY